MDCIIPNLSFRSARSGDRTAVAKIVLGIDNFYPNALTWFDDKFDKVLLGKSECIVVEFHSTIVGIAILTDKGCGKKKLCTFKIDPNFRGLGIGKSLMQFIKAGMLKSDIHSIWVTVNNSLSDALGFFANASSFKEVTSLPGRYFEDQIEQVLTYTIER